MDDSNEGPSSHPGDRDVDNNQEQSRLHLLTGQAVVGAEQVDPTPTPDTAMADSADITEVPSQVVENSNHAIPDFNWTPLDSTFDRSYIEELQRSLRDLVTIAPSDVGAVHNEVEDDHDGATPPRDTAMADNPIDTTEASEESEVHLELLLRRAGASFDNAGAALARAVDGGVRSLVSEAELRRLNENLDSERRSLLEIWERAHETRRRLQSQRSGTTAALNLPIAGPDEYAEGGPTLADIMENMPIPMLPAFVPNDGGIRWDLLPAQEEEEEEEEEEEDDDDDDADSLPSLEEDDNDVPPPLEHNLNDFHTTTQSPLAMHPPQQYEAPPTRHGHLGAYGHHWEDGSMHRYAPATTTQPPLTMHPPQQYGAPPTQLGVYGHQPSFPSGWEDRGYMQRYALTAHASPHPQTRGIAAPPGRNDQERNAYLAAMTTESLLRDGPDDEIDPAARAGNIRSGMNNSASRYNTGEGRALHIRLAEQQQMAMRHGHRPEVRAEVSARNGPYGAASPEDEMVRLYAHFQEGHRLPLVWNAGTSFFDTMRWRQPPRPTHPWNEQSLRAMAFLTAEQIVASRASQTAHTVLIGSGLRTYRVEDPRTSHRPILDSTSPAPSVPRRAAFALPEGHMQTETFARYVQFYIAELTTAREMVARPPPHRVTEESRREAAIAETVADFNGTVDEETLCQICLGAFHTGDCENPSTIVHARCTCRTNSRVYGRECINTWLREEVTCPVCRNPVITLTGRPRRSGPELIDMNWRNYFRASGIAITTAVPTTPVQVASDESNTVPSAIGQDTSTETQLPNVQPEIGPDRAAPSTISAYRRLMEDIEQQLAVIQGHPGGENATMIGELLELLQLVREFRESGPELGTRAQESLQLARQLQLRDGATLPVNNRLVVINRDGSTGDFDFIRESYINLDPEATLRFMENRLDILQNHFDDVRPANITPRVLDHIEEIYAVLRAIQIRPGRHATRAASGMRLARDLVDRGVAAREAAASAVTATAAAELTRDSLSFQAFAEQIRRVIGMVARVYPPPAQAPRRENLGQNLLNLSSTHGDRPRTQDTPIESRGRRTVLLRANPMVPTSAEYRSGEAAQHPRTVGETGTPRNLREQAEPEPGAALREHVEDMQRRIQQDPSEREAEDAALRNELADEIRAFREDFQQNRVPMTSPHGVRVAEFEHEYETRDRDRAILSSLRLPQGTTWFPMFGRDDVLEENMHRIDHEINRRCRRVEALEAELQTITDIVKGAQQPEAQRETFVERAARIAAEIPSDNTEETTADRLPGLRHSATNVQTEILVPSNDRGEAAGDGIVENPTVHDAGLPAQEPSNDEEEPTNNRSER